MSAATEVLGLVLAQQAAPGAWGVAGWGCAAGALGTLAHVHRRVGSRMALVAEASHELRGPLAAVSLGLATLVRDAEPDRARRAAALDLELRRAGLALDDLAAAPDGRRAPDRAGPVDVGDLLEEAGAVWAGVAMAYGVELRAEAPAQWWVVRADRVRLAQALGNLIANAVEHGRGPVAVRAREAATGRLRIEVADHGTGLGDAVTLPVAGGGCGRRGHGLAVAARVAARAGGRLVSERRAAEHVMAIELPLPACPRRPAALAGAAR